MADNDGKSWKSLKPVKKGFNFGGLDLDDVEERKSPAKLDKSPLKRGTSALGPARLPPSADAMA